jgi:hypothetical protein
MRKARHLAISSRLEATKQYGLVESSEQGVRVSDLAMEILHRPAGSPERAAASIRNRGARCACTSDLRVDRVRSSFFRASFADIVWPIAQSACITCRKGCKGSALRKLSQ